MLAGRGNTLLLLDEPTSSIDPATEARLYDALFAEFPDACLVSILHRPHLLPRFDRVLVMAAGHLRPGCRPAA
jgi:ATP-binding cassette, subfamily B, bacterial